MKPLFLQLLRRFHVPAGVRTLEEFGTLRGFVVTGTVECRHNCCFETASATNHILIMFQYVIASKIDFVGILN